MVPFGLTRMRPALRTGWSAAGRGTAHARGPSRSLFASGTTRSTGTTDLGFRCARGLGEPSESGAASARRGRSRASQTPRGASARGRAEAGVETPPWANSAGEDDYGRYADIEGQRGVAADALVSAGAVSDGLAGG